jgi:hypothetical protein
MGKTWRCAVISDEKLSKAAKELARRGAGKGGRARASVLTPSERSEIARHAVRERWRRQGKLKEEFEDNGPNWEDDTETTKVSEPGEPYSILRGTLKIGDAPLECHVLNDLRRVLTQREVVRILSPSGRESGNLSRYLERNPLYQPAFLAGRTIEFRVPGAPSMATGYEGTLLVEICEMYLTARAQGLLKRSQLPVAQAAEIVVRACAKVGIIALIDEATGFQELRRKHSLQLKLQAFIADEMQEWAKLFPDEFWFELARLEGVHYSPRSRPLRWGKYVMLFVYDAIDEDVGKELRSRNPNPHFLQNHHQWLNKFGRDKVHDQLERVITVMKLCRGMDDFRHKFARVFKRTSFQWDFDDMEWIT